MKGVDSENPPPEGADGGGELARCRSLLFQSASLAEMGREVSGLVHEINQPLLAIKAFAQMIRKEAGDDRLSRRSAFIEEQAVVIQGMLERVRRFGRLTRVDPAARARIEEGVDGALTILGHRLREAEVEVQREWGEVLPDVAMDPTHLQQLLVNLVANAVDAVRQRPLRHIGIRVWTEGEAVILAVEDSGGGVPEQMRDRIFDPFFTTKGQREGTGLGLAICREIVEAYGGELSLACRPDLADRPAWTDTAFVARLRAVG